ncbi:hypothetical protein C4561_04410 [candidate division WWE3 bacterium]|jgi:hypothetical protein|uniref:Dipeptidylpeptidase IV N-terminal domain-containing protein n=1 Tax=candidate division WWE3 bacterium TaxID=2053526 RepID=A0A3A4ZJY4_UNCKA|nr:MAG: hypothetical protein C4561_04410 [candidate division WWE3 bacterium]
MLKTNKIYGFDETGSGIISVISAFVLGVIIAITSGFYLYKSGMIQFLMDINNNSVSNVINAPVGEKWKPLISKKKGYPLIDAAEKKLKVFDLENKLVKETGILAACCGGELEVGDIEPSPSPNLLFTVYIDQSSKDLWLLSNDTLEKQAITKTGNVTYISAWSPDSTKVIFFVNRDSLSERKDGPIPWGTIENFKEEEMNGFYMFDISNGKLTALSPLSNIIAFVNEDTVLSRVADTRFVTFNVEKFIGDYTKVKDEFGFGVSQFNFSMDGKKWAFTHSFNPTEDANIILAEFPNKTGTIIDSHSWAHVQWPVISPDGTKVLYQRYDSDISSGIPDVYVWLYNSSQGSVPSIEKTFSEQDELTAEQDATISDALREEDSNPVQITRGRPLLWVNENTAVIETVEIGTDGAILRKPALLELSTKEVTVME